MSERKVKVRLYGKLRQFGRDFEFYVRTKKEVFDALSSQLKGFRQFMLSAEAKGMGFAIFEDKKNLGKDDLNFTAREGTTIRIAPMIGGRKSGGFIQILVGAALIAGAMFIPGLAAAAPGTMAAFGATAMTGIGLSLVAGGVASMLSPKTSKVKGYEQDGNVASYGFGGATTTTSQGNPVPILYGERLVGGAVASAGIYAEDKA